MASMRPTVLLSALALAWAVLPGGSTLAQDPPQGEPEAPVRPDAEQGPPDSPADPSAAPEAPAPAEEAPPGEEPEEAPPGDAAPEAAPPPPEPDLPPVDEEQARIHTRLARAFYGSGRFEEAAREFERAYMHSRRPEVLYDIFLARRDAGQIGQAIEALERYLDLVPEAPQRDILTVRLSNMRRLEARRNRSREADEAQDGNEPETAAEAPPSEVEPEASAPAVLRPRREDLEAEDESRSRLPAVVMTTGASLIVAGAITGGLALRTERQLVRMCGQEGVCPPDTSFEAKAARGSRLATATDVLLGLGIASLGAGVALHFLLEDVTARAPTRPDGPTASLGCGPGGCMGTVRVGF
jgi:tetratricopeptide (TPR) repeat protein